MEIYLNAESLPYKERMTANIEPPSLAAVNFFLGCVGVVQVSRILMYRRSLAGSSQEAIKDMEHDITGSAKSAGEQAETAVKKST